MGIKRMWDTLISAGITDAGAAAILGNLKAESLLKSNNLQDTANRSLGLTDEEFTARVDDGRITRDQLIAYGKQGIGYGLAQWTYWSRLAGLYDAARIEGTSIADEGMQIRYLLSELNQYGALLQKFKTSNDLESLTAQFCHEFERPADENTVLRTRYAREIFENHSDGSGRPEPAGTGQDFRTVNASMPLLYQGCKGEPVRVLQTILNLHECGLAVDADFGPATAEAVQATQVLFGLDPDGIVGRLTWSTLAGL